MSNRTETSFSPCCQVAVSFAPAVEAYAKSTSFEYSVSFGECGVKPSVVRVARNRATVSGLIVDQIGWISNDEIDRIRRNLLHDKAAVPKYDGIEKIVKCRVM